MRKLILLLFFSGSILCWGQEEASGTVIFYRHGGMYGSALQFPIVVDGQPAGSVHNGSYLKVSLGPGAHALSSTATGAGAMHKDTDFTLNVQPRMTYYLRVDVKPADLSLGQSVLLKLMPTEEGQKDVAKLKPPKVKPLN
jgi:hypothetical protein